MENKYFVNQKKHNKNTEAWDNNVHVKNTLDEAMHQFHAFMSTYAYSVNAELDYVACSVTDMYGYAVKPEEIWRAPEEPEVVSE